MSLIRWKIIEGVDAHSRISDRGVVKQTHKIVRGKLICGFLRVQLLDHKGARFVTFRVGGKQKNLYVHRLVAKAFIPNDEALPFVAWRDGDLTNNHMLNLMWTRQLLGSRGSGKRKLKAEDAVSIREQAARGLSMTAISLRYNVSVSLISRIVAGTRWI